MCKKEIARKEEMYRNRGNGKNRRIKKGGCVRGALASKQRRKRRISKSKKNNGQRKARKKNVNGVTLRKLIKEKDEMCEYRLCKSSRDKKKKGGKQIVK